MTHFNHALLPGTCVRTGLCVLCDVSFAASTRFFFLSLFNALEFLDHLNQILSVVTKAHSFLFLLLSVVDYLLIAAAAYPFDDVKTVHTKSSEIFLHISYNMAIRFVR